VLVLFIKIGFPCDDNSNKMGMGVKKRRVATQSEIIRTQLAVGGGVPSCCSLCRQLQFARDSCNVTTSLGSLGLMGLINF
jgi:hypothetical protein